MTPERIAEIINEESPGNWLEKPWLMVAANKIREEHTKEINAAWDLGYADGKKMQKLSDRLDSLSQPSSSRMSTEDKASINLVDKKPGQVGLMREETTGQSGVKAGELETVTPQVYNDVHVQWSEPKHAARKGTPNKEWFKPELIKGYENTLLSLGKGTKHAPCKGCTECPKECRGTYVHYESGLVGDCPCVCHKDTDNDDYVNVGEKK